MYSAAVYLHVTEVSFILLPQWQIISDWPSTVFYISTTFLIATGSTQYGHRSTITEDRWTNRIVSAEISLSRSPGRSPSQCGWSAAPPWSSLTTAALHRSPDASWETAACCPSLARSPLVYSNLGKEGVEWLLSRWQRGSAQLWSAITNEVQLILTGCFRYRCQGDYDFTCCFLVRLLVHLSAGLQIPNIVEGGA